jgi:hypothetical protein
MKFKEYIEEKKTDSEDKYAKMKPIRGEKKYVEEDDGYWHIFGDQSGFSYGQYRTEKAAKDALAGK